MPVLSPKRQVTLPKELCDRLRLNPGDRIEFLEHGGRITIIKRMKGTTDGLLRHVKPDRRYSDEESLRDAIPAGGRRDAAKRRAA